MERENRTAIFVYPFFVEENLKQASTLKSCTKFPRVLGLKLLKISHICQTQEENLKQQVGKKKSDKPFLKSLRIYQIRIQKYRVGHKNRLCLSTYKIRNFISVA